MKAYRGSMSHLDSAKILSSKLAHNCRYGGVESHDVQHSSVSGIGIGELGRGNADDDQP